MRLAFDGLEAVRFPGSGVVVTGVVCLEAGVGVGALLPKPVWAALALWSFSPAFPLFFFFRSLFPPSLLLSTTSSFFAPARRYTPAITTVAWPIANSLRHRSRARDSSRTHRIISRALSRSPVRPQEAPEHAEIRVGHPRFARKTPSLAR
ncbi:hypothetical protein Dda_5007 [Drechslerella dactyloides]|uniref:Uncharacterized protein n=1 Tax=Drechslerella dactyloides TaxID=74499 RepID=A0AAD6IXY1_DREDA|nr:hypothetical protein Dda_5007 [Drechslerella dactyloides]